MAQLLLDVGRVEGGTMNPLSPWLLSSNPYDETPSNPTRFPQERFTPMFAIHETPEAYDIEAELPLSKRRDVSVEPRGRYIEIWCGRAMDHDDDDREPHPPRFGSFVSRLTLGHAIDVAHTRVTFEHGILLIHAPKEDPAN
jgi:HSP20 family protein